MKLAAAGIVLLVTSACRSEETKRCLSLFEQAQAAVRDVKSSELDSVAHSLESVEAARAACAKAERNHEADELLKAENQLSGHLAYMKRKAGELKQRALTPEQLARLVKRGDPDCPKGQAYKHDGKEIRCSGPQIAEMSLKRAKAYFEARGHSVTVKDGQLEAEYGAERILYRYRTSAGSAPPTCVVIHAPPGMSWQESAARATGVPPNRIRADEPLTVGGRSVDFRFEGEDGTYTLYLGDCGA